MKPLSRLLPKHSIACLAALAAVFFSSGVDAVGHTMHPAFRRNPLTLADWLRVFDTDGRIAGRHDDKRLADYAEILTRIAKHVGDLWPRL